MEPKRTAPRSLFIALIVAAVIAAGGLMYHAAQAKESGERVQTTTYGSVQPGTKASGTDAKPGQAEQNDGDGD